MTAKQEAIELGKRRLAQQPGYTPEHSGIGQDGRALPINEAMPGGGMVVDRDTLKAQSEPGPEMEVHPLSPDRPAIDAQREANKAVAADRQKESERLAKLPEAEQPKDEKADHSI